MRFYLTILLCLTLSSAFAKEITSVSELPVDARPASTNLKSLLSPVGLVELPSIDVKQLNEKALSDKAGTGPYRFAEPVEDKSLWQNKVAWQVVGDTAVMKIKFVSNGVSLNIGLTNVFLPKGAKLFFYTPDGKQVAAFDDSDNKSHGQLWSPVFEEKELILEVNTPAQMQKYTTFNIKQVSQGFRSVKATSLKSGDCNINVVCFAGDAWQQEASSVARIVISGSGLCTGTLVNNVLEDETPYFLSANHCGLSETIAPTLVFYWNFEASQCNMTTDQADGSLNQFQTGSTFRAAHQASDLALVQLDTTPDAGFNVFYSGWSNDPAAPTSAVAIHHPNGDEKRISFENDALTITNYSSDTTVTNGTHLRVGAWDLGTTEGGSSGSAIWNANRHIVGTLHGGAASCSAPNAPDWYGRLAVQWDGGGTAATQLSAWLDPNATSAVSVDGLGACTRPTIDLTVSNSAPALGSSVTFSASASGGSGAGYTYRWDLNGDGAVDATGTTAEFTYNFFYRDNIYVSVSDGSGCVETASSAITVTEPATEIFTENGNIPLNWNQPSGSAAEWLVVSNEAFEGSVSLRAGNVSDNQISSIQTTYEFTEASGNFIAFAAKTSSEEGFDFLTFSIDGVQQLSLSGISDWNTYYFEVTPGTHTLRWSYEKDESVSEGSDTAWIDAVTGITLEPGTSTGGSGGSSGGGSGGGSISIWLLTLLLFRRFVKFPIKEK
ncbi:MAG: trypsin-like peptidase domain-containing protein [Gammaproteobacteria bacterium]|nr:trypsin-like peptidase domain-containing protein [Gammaproteobacteria bacterium]